MKVMISLNNQNEFNMEKMMKTLYQKQDTPMIMITKNQMTIRHKVGEFMVEVVPMISHLNHVIHMLKKMFRQNPEDVMLIHKNFIYLPKDYQVTKLILKILHQSREANLTEKRKLMKTILTLDEHMV